tara:strand:- start:293 stop:862 length:570 start_codon:yes stop_codon:yes gene_type:complete
MKPPLFTELTEDSKERAFLLKNPKTPHYGRFKEFILGREFEWYRWDRTCPLMEDSVADDFPFLSHNFLKRPGGNRMFSQVNSRQIPNMNHLFTEICKHNEIDPKVIYRMNANAVYPTERNLPSPPHVDHDFPHYNMIVYLTNPQGGWTIVDGEEYETEEDDILIFNGELKHCAKPPSKDVRVVLVTTFL